MSSGYMNGTYIGTIYYLKVKAYVCSYKNSKVTGKRSGIVNLISKEKTLEGLKRDKELNILNQMGLTKTKTDWSLVDVEILKCVETNKQRI